MREDSMPTKDSIGCSLDGQKGNSVEQPRSINSVRPGDIVRYWGDTWDVTGLHLSTDKRFSTITLIDPNDRFKTELRLPLSIVETACEVFLKVEKPVE